MKIQIPDWPSPGKRHLDCGRPLLQVVDNLVKMVQDVAHLRIRVQQGTGIGADSILEIVVGEARMRRQR